jgi:hypothetical protein
METGVLLVSIPKKQSIRHIPCAAALEKQSFLSRSGRHSECACYFLNGIVITAFNSQPKTYFAVATSQHAPSADGETTNSELIPGLVLNETVRTRRIRSRRFSRMV